MAFAFNEHLTLGELGKTPGRSFHSFHLARNVCRILESKMAYRDEIDDAFDAAVFLEERYIFTLLKQ